MLEEQPHVPEEAYPFAVLWTQHANPRRGCPVRPWDAAAGRPVPKRRAARGA